MVRIIRILLLSIVGLSVINRARCLVTPAGVKGGVLVLLRHGESTWNRDDRFIGWSDVPLTKKGIAEAREAGNVLKDNGFDFFDVAYSSMLKRTIKTCTLALDELNLQWISQVRSAYLNERFFGCMVGKKPEEAVKAFGKDNCALWRGSYTIPPAPMEKTSELHPWNEPRYQGFDVPSTESMQEVERRISTFWHSDIKEQVLSGKKVLVVAHSVCLKTLMRHIDDADREKTVKFAIPRATPIVYYFDEKGMPIRDATNESSAPLFSGRFLSRPSSVIEAEALLEVNAF